MATHTVRKEAPGEFRVYRGETPTRINIINGSHGFTGSGAANTYGVQLGNKVVWAGSLNDAKKLALQWASARA